ncbi:hypothetical protein BJ165DRAFT_1516614 [Panaeolus papilionaceus]|nr:hypothetical protein BJ165DRAFT_1516614 [Panaeolus papilionaceus]
MDDLLAWMEKCGIATPARSPKNAGKSLIITTVVSFDNQLTTFCSFDWRNPTLEEIQIFAANVSFAHEFILRFGDTQTLPMSILACSQRMPSWQLGANLLRRSSVIYLTSIVFCFSFPPTILESHTRIAFISQWSAGSNVFIHSTSTVIINQ